MRGRIRADKHTITVSPSQSDERKMTLRISCDWHRASTMYLDLSDSALRNLADLLWDAADSIRNERIRRALDAVKGEQA